jgi:phenylalanyl-tRNA synthetase alpha chain
MDPESLILTALSTSPTASIPDTHAFSTSHSLDHNTVVGISKSLEGDAYITLKDINTQFYVLSNEAEEILDKGSQEMIVLNALIAAGEEGMNMQELEEKVGKSICKIGMGNCLKNKWAKKEKDGRLVAVVAEMEDEVRGMLGKLKEGEGEVGALDDKVRD